MKSDSKPPKKQWIYVFGIATALSLAFSAQYYVSFNRATGSFKWTEEIYRDLTNWYLWAAVFPLIQNLGRKFRFDSGTRLKSFFVHLGVGTAIAFLHASIYIFTTDWILSPDHNWNVYKKAFENSFLSMFLWRIVLYHAILSVCIALDMHRTALESEIQSAQIEAGILQAQIESLKMQIDPDFVFKSLDQLTDLMHYEIDEADNMVARLGDYLRVTLENSRNSEVSLSEEIDFLKCYIEIENITHNHIDIQFDIDPDTMYCDVPSLILQAPVENAIRNKADQDFKKLKIRARKTDSKLILTIIDPQNLIQDSKGPRVRQLIERLNTLYETRIQMRNFIDPEGDKTQIEIPLILEKRNLSEIIPAEMQSIDAAPLPETDSSPVRKWLVIVIVFTGLAVYFLLSRAMVLIAKGQPVDWAAQLLNTSGWFIWALITPIILKLSAKYPLQRKHFLKNFTVHFFALAACWFSATLAIIGVRWAANLGQISFSTLLPPGFATSPFSFDILCYGTIMAVESSVRYYRRVEKNKIRSAKLSSQLGRARLQALKMQLHPHFLFNALNSLSELMQEDPAAAQQMIENLEKFLQLTMKTNHVQEIPFEEELEFLKCYLAIEHVRFQNRLNITMDIEPQILKVPVPNLVLQPLVENAIRHGIAPRKTAGQIEIKASRKNGMLMVSIQDNGPGLNRSHRKVLNGGLGLTNTRERLAQLYGNSHRFEMINAPEGGLIVMLEIPVSTNGVH
jgi:two-component system, LytTR family, sensor kinase